MWPMFTWSMIDLPAVFVHVSPGDNEIKKEQTECEGLVLWACSLKQQQQ